MYKQFNKMTRLLRVALAVVTTVGALTIPTAGHAMDWYGGLSVANSNHEVTGGDILGQGFSGSVDGNSSGWKIFAGLELWEKYVGAEFGYVDLGKAKASGQILGVPSSGTSEAKAYTASLVGLIPFGGGQSGMTIRLGLAGEQISVERAGAVGSGVSTASHTSDLKVFGGLGAQFYFSKTVGMRFEMDRYNMGSLGSPYINTISVGLLYQFEK